MELDIRSVGRAATIVEVDFERVIEEEDLKLLALPRESAKPPLIKRLRDRHHRLAQLLAQGYSERDAAIITNYDISRVSILKNDPSFQHLLDHYREKVEDKFDLFADKLATIASEAAAELVERLEDDEGVAKLTPQQLIALVELGADRIGYGKQTKNESLNVNVGLSDKLEDARKRIEARKREERAMKTIEGEVDAGPAS